MSNKKIAHAFVKITVQDGVELHGDDRRQTQTQVTRSRKSARTLTYSKESTKRKQPAETLNFCGLPVFTILKGADLSCRVAPRPDARFHIKPYGGMCQEMVFIVVHVGHDVRRADAPSSHLHVAVFQPCGG